MKVEGKLIVEQKIEPKEVKEVDLHSLSLGKKNKSSLLYLLPLEDIFLALSKSSGEDQLILNVLIFETERTWT